MENPIIRYGHKHPVGKAIKEETSIDRANKAFLVTAYITDKTAKGREAWNLIEEGIIKSFSIGGRVIARDTVKEGGREIKKITDMELYEVSVVDIPSNRKSFFEVIAKSIEKEVDAEQELINKIVPVVVNEFKKQTDKDKISQDMFNKPYSELTDEEKAKVDAKLTPEEKSTVQDVNKPGAGTHSAKWDDCVRDVRARGGVDSPEAVCTASLGEESFNRSAKELTSNEKKEIDSSYEKIKKYESCLKEFKKLGGMRSTTDESKNKKEEEQCQKKLNLKNNLTNKLLKKLQQK